MKNRSRVIAATLIALLAGCGGEPAEEPEVAAREDVPEIDMVEWERIATPGEHHAHLGLLAGNWRTQAKIWPAPGEPPETATGTIRAEWTLGGRFLLMSYQGEFMGAPFQGVSFEGYDNAAEHYVSVWMDTMGTAINQFIGHCEQEGRVRTMISEYDDPLTGLPMKTRGVTTIVDPNRFTYTSYLTRPKGTEFKNLEMTASRL
jgi:hypothetical protein